LVGNLFHPGQAVLKKISRNEVGLVVAGLLIFKLMIGDKTGSVFDAKRNVKPKLIA